MAATATAPERTVQYPDEFPTDKQFWLICKLLRDNPRKVSFPTTRLQASTLINKLKKAA